MPPPGHPSSARPHHNRVRIEYYVCRILAVGRHLGTGFLIDDDLVITASHVLEPVLEQAGSGWRTTTRLVCEFQRSGKLGSVECWIAPVIVAYDAKLDVAVLRLEHPRGSDKIAGGSFTVLRHWAPLAPDLDGLRPEGTVSLFHHPDGHEQQFTEGKFLRAYEGGRECLVHNVESQPGSSGAPLYADECGIIALHRGSLTQQPEERLAIRGQSIRNAFPSLFEQADRRRGQLEAQRPVRRHLWSDQRVQNIAHAIVLAYDDNRQLLGAMLETMHNFDLELISMKADSMPDAANKLVRCADTVECLVDLLQQGPKSKRADVKMILDSLTREAEASSRLAPLVARPVTTVEEIHSAWQFQRRIFFNRSRLRAYGAKGMTSGVLIVRKGPGVGKSYSVHLLREVFDWGNVIVFQRMNMSDSNIDLETVLHRIFNWANAPLTERRESERRWIGDRVTEVLKLAKNNSGLCLVFDGWDGKYLTPEVRDFIQVLIANQTPDSRLTVALLGIDDEALLDEIEAFNPANYEVHDVGSITLNDVKDCLRGAWQEMHGHAPCDADLAPLLDGLADLVDNEVIADVRAANRRLVKGLTERHPTLVLS